LESTVTIFFSSPDDVRPERETAARVVTRLKREFTSHTFNLKTTFWERNALRSTARFQEQIPLGSEADIVVVILWSTLGTLLPHPRFSGAMLPTRHGAIAARDRV
jgi:hypothetical protein